MCKIVTMKRKTSCKYFLITITIVIYHGILLYRMKDKDEHSTSNADNLVKEPMSTVSEPDTKPATVQTTTQLEARVPKGLMLDAVYGMTVFGDEVPPVASNLDSTLVPNIVFYAWCGTRQFDFANFLSVLSVIRFLQPDNIFFYYERLPQTDKNLYHTWFEELQDLYPHLVTVPIKQPTNLVCAGNVTTGDFVLEIMKSSGGIYIHENVILNTHADQLRQPPTRNSETVCDLSKNILVSDRGSGFQECLPCVTKEQLTPDSLCVTMDKKIFPEQFWTAPDLFSELVRRVYYRTTETIIPRQSTDTLAPNIAHLVWMGGKPIDFLFYLSVLSLIYVAEVEHVYIHSESPLSGEFWNKIKQEPKIVLLYRHPNSGKVYDKDIKAIQHWSDVLRLDILIKYGGLYMDVDTIIVKPLDDVIRSYDAVVSLDFPGRPPWPNYINNGVMLGKKNAEFFRRFLETFKWLHEDSFHWNCVYQPYKVLERHPHLAFINPHLQVMCAFEEGYCHPTWVKGFHFRHIHHESTNSIVDWKRDAYVYHITGTPPSLQSVETCVSAKDMLGEICQHVLKKSGRL